MTRPVVWVALWLLSWGFACTPQAVEPITLAPRTPPPRRWHPVQLPAPVEPAPRVLPARGRFAREAFPAAWLPDGGRISTRWTTIVIHHSATDTGCAATFDRSHRAQGWDELGYHFVIGNGTSSGDGVIEVGSRWRRQKHGAHCKTDGNYFNDHGIGICLVGNFEDEYPTPAQMQSLVYLVSHLCRTCDIPPSRVTGHRQVTSKTACPGRHFPLAWLRSQLTGSTTANALP